MTRSALASHIEKNAGYWFVEEMLTMSIRSVSDDAIHVPWYIMQVYRIWTCASVESVLVREKHIKTYVFFQCMSPIYPNHEGLGEFIPSEYMYIENLALLIFLLRCSPKRFLVIGYYLWVRVADVGPNLQKINLHSYQSHAQLDRNSGNDGSRSTRVSESRIVWHIQLHEVSNFGR